MAEQLELMKKLIEDAINWDDDQMRHGRHEQIVLRNLHRERTSKLF